MAVLAPCSRRREAAAMEFRGSEAMGRGLPSVIGKSLLQGLRVKLTWTLLIVLWGLLAGGCPVHAEPEPAEEHLVKSAFIYNFAKFVEWPSGTFADNAAPLVLCVLGEDPMQVALTTVAGKMIGAHPLVVKAAAPNEDLPECHMLFISGAQHGELGAILNRIGRRPVLTIGDSEGFARGGVIINLAKARGKIRFEINLEAAKRGGLNISSKLLKLATIVGASP